MAARPHFIKHDYKYQSHNDFDSQSSPKAPQSTRASMGSKSDGDSFTLVDLDLDPSPKHTKEPLKPKATPLKPITEDSYGETWLDRQPRVEEPPKKVRRRWWLWLLLVPIVLAAILGPVLLKTLSKKYIHHGVMCNTLELVY
jgi:hypothetical protein